MSADSFVSPEYKVRHAAEIKMIEKAKLTGQPIFGICGGSWTLYQSYGGKLTSVEGHAYRGGMPRLSKNDSVVSNNKPLHRLNLISNHTLLQAALHVPGKSAADMAVNSVHSMAPCNKSIPKQIVVSATARGDITLIPAKAKPTEENTIEAFETEHGAPVLGIQWHPEAYENNTQHAALVKYMMLAGQAYTNKRKMLHELVKEFDNVKSGLNRTKKLGFNNTVVKKEINGHVNFSLFKGKKSDQLRHEDEARLEAEIKWKYLSSARP